MSEKGDGDFTVGNIGGDAAVSKEGSATIDKSTQGSKKGPCEKFLSAIGKKLDGMFGLG